MIIEAFTRRTCLEFIEKGQKIGKWELKILKMGKNWNSAQNRNFFHFLKNQIMVD